MKGIEALYLTIIALSMCCVYMGIYFYLHKMCKKEVKGFDRQSVYSLSSIVILSACIYMVSYYVIPHEALGNRFLHVFGGGFMVFLACYFVVRDATISISRKRLFLIGFLLMMSLGFLNEIAELIIQQFTVTRFAPSSLDTFLDILSNIAGFLIATVVLMPRIPTLYPSSQKHSEDPQ